MANNRNGAKIFGSGLIGWFIDNHVAANLLMILFIGGGLLAIFSMRTELFPTINPRIINVTVPYPGATPHEVEDGITRRVEEALIEIEGVARVTSIARENMGVVTLEVEDFADMDDVVNDAENAVDQLADFPPQNAEDPMITQAKPQPSVITLVLSGEVPELTLKNWAKRIEDDLLRRRNISLVSLHGDRDYEISIEIPEENLRKYGLTIAEAGRMIRNSSLDLPAGTVESESGDILLRVQEKKYMGAAFKDIVIKSRADGSLLRLKDIANIVDGFKDVNLVARHNGKRAIFIKVSRSESQDTLKVARAVKDYLKSAKLPPGIDLDILEDQTEILKSRMNLLTRNALLGYALVFIALLVFLDLKLAFWTSLGIPISFLGGLLCVFMLGMSFNMVTLFALIVVLGIVVDDAIVTGESIFVEQESGKEDEKAAIAGVQAVRAPVSIGVFTTVAAFAPLAFTTGTLGQIMRPIPIFVISILLISLLEAFTILPAHLSSSSRWSRGVVLSINKGFSQLLRKFVDQLLLPVLRVAVRWRYAVLAAFVALLIIIGAMLRVGIIRFIFFPQIEGSRVTATLIMPVGTPFEVTRHNAAKMMNAAEQVAAELREKAGKSLFESTSLLVGGRFSQQTPPASQGGGAAGGNSAELQIQLIDPPRRDISAQEVANRLRETIGAIPNADELSFQSSLVSGGPDINIELAHTDAAVLDAAAAELKKRMRAMSGVTEVTDSLKPGKLEYVFELTSVGLAAGLKPADLGFQLRNAFYGYEVQRIQREQSELRVMVRYPESDRESIASISDFRVRLPNGDSAALEKVARIRQQKTYAEIIRVNGQRVTSVTADVVRRITTPEEALGGIMEKITPDLREAHPELGARVAGQSEDRREDLASLFRNMAIALLLIFALLGAQLRSYIQPAIIMAVIPFGMVGAVLGHLLLGFDLSFISIFGIVALTGVVINDSVVLIDYYNKRREELGDFPEEAVFEAVRRRFRPILLTTLTTSLALLPMLLETSLQARFLIPMAISLAFGLLFASFVLLFLLPILIRIVYDLRRWAGAVK
ncbi:MAG: efflux RND transporter permease subunit [Desulfobacterales bacterium]|nr:efflux RND transporter permease subunit [Desulfobacterales bacterium]